MKTCTEGAVRILFLYENGVLHSKKILSNDDSSSFSQLEDNWLPIAKGSNFGVSVANLGDLDGPGPARVVLAIGNERDDNETGAVWLVFLDENYDAIDYRYYSGTGNSLGGALTGYHHFGGALAPLGDLDGAGGSRLALAVGAPKSQDTATGFYTGSVWILFLDANGDVVRHTQFPSPDGGLQGVLPDGANFGRQLLARPDGVPQLLVSTPGQGAINVVELSWDGRATAMTTKTKGNTPELGDCLGSEQIEGGLEWIPAGGDGTGVKLAIGTNGADIDGDATGAIRVVSGFLSTLPPVTDVGSPGPRRPPMLRVRPNPSSAGAFVHFELRHGGHAMLEVFDVRGRAVDQIELGQRPAGAGVFDWETTGLPSGTYFLRLSVDGRTVNSSKHVRLK